MKRIFFLLAFVITTWACFAQRQVPRSAAVAAATRQLSQLDALNTNSECESVYVKTNASGDTLLYEVRFENKNSVVVSGNKKCKAILGYCLNTQKPILPNFDSLPNGLKAFIDDFCEQNDFAFHNNLKEIEDHADWNNRLVGIKKPPNIVVDCLLTSEWGQKYPNSGIDHAAYNYYSPVGNCTNDYKCPTGCVATAMGQIMRYWNYPVYLPEVWQFDWCNMPDELDTGSENYAKERHAISFLLRQCGDAVDMDYCSSDDCRASSAQNSDVDDALIDIFSYSPDADYKIRLGYTNAAWIAMIKDNLDNGWPVLYGGQYNFDGHSFVCDGYTSDNFFHFNWGWNGRRNNWFTLDSLMPGEYNFNRLQDAVFNIHPASNIDYCNFTLPLWVHYASYYLQNNSPQPYYNVPSTFTHLISVPDEYQSSWRTIPAGVTAAYEAHSSVTLVPGFHAEQGSNFTVRIDPCPTCEELRQRGSVQQTDNLRDKKVMPSEYSISKRADDIDRLKVYPNPTNGIVNVSVPYTSSYNLYVRNETGQLIYCESGIEAMKHEVDLSRFPQGIYMVSVETSNKLRTIKVVLK